MISHAVARQLAVRCMIAMACCLLSAPSAHAQDDDKLPPNDWGLDAVGKLSFTQAAYRNWREGGLNTLSFTGGIDAKARRHSAMWKQEHEMRLGYGLIQQDTLRVRKAEDIIRLSSNLQYQGEDFFSAFNPTLAAQLRTQFAPGYNYDKVPPVLQEQFEVPLKTPVKVSDFLSPAVVTQTVGLTYNSSSWVSQRVGFAFKETMVLIERFRPLNYGADSEQLDQPLRFEAGLESNTEVDHEIFENVQLKSSLGLFYAYNQLKEAPDALWENTLSMGVNDWLSVNLEGSLLYDRNVDTQPQLKQILSVGVSYALI